MSRVVVVHHAPFIGGGTTSFADIIDILKDNHEVLAVVPSSPRDAFELVLDEGVKTLDPKIAFPTYGNFNGGPSILSRGFWHKSLFSRDVYRRWSRILRELQPDLVIANSVVLAPLGWSIRDAGAQAICIVRETLPANRHIRNAIAYRMLSSNFDGVLFISDFDRKQARDVDAIVGILRDCVRPTRFVKVGRADACRALGVDAASFNVLFAGGSSWIKGLDVALKAIASPRVPEMRLLVAGYRPDMAPKRRMAQVRSQIPTRAHRFDRDVNKLLQDPSITQRTEFLGPQDDMSACYSAADVVIFPAVTPHQARPIIEASHYGLPVVTSRYPQYYENAPDLFTFEPGDSDSLQRILESLARNRELGRTAGARNLEYLRKHRDYDVEGKRLLSFVEQIAESSV